MLPYPHFAIQNLLLVNGYEEARTPQGVLRTYRHEDLLENCIRRVLLRKPERVRGWDLRFLRRGLELSQAQFGRMVDRDPQTVARWEKSKRGVPVFVDLTIRSRFAERFEPAISLKEILSYVDGSAPKLPRVVLLTYENGRWSFSLQPQIVVSQAVGLARSTLILPHVPDSAIVLYTGEARGETVRARPTSATKQEKEGVTLWESTGRMLAPFQRQVIAGPLDEPQHESIEFQNVRSSETRH